jgi:hypothetical protein
MVGDIVRVRYNCMIAGTNELVMSTKNTLERPWVEFVLGIDQVIRGFDRSLPLMSIGERSKMVFTPEYACKLAIVEESFAQFLLYYLCRWRRRSPSEHPPKHKSFI